MERQGKGLDVFCSGMSIVMTDVEGSTALWEWNSRVMSPALALHDHTLRSLLPKYFGYEVSPSALTYSGTCWTVWAWNLLKRLGISLLKHHVMLAVLSKQHCMHIGCVLCCKQTFALSFHEKR